MKHWKNLLLLLCMVMLTTGCHSKTEKLPQDSVHQTTSEPTLPIETEQISTETEMTAEEIAAAEEERYADELAEKLRQTMPVTDGSTSAIPLDASIRAAVLGISYDEAEKQVIHTTTYGSFDRLLKGECNFVFNLLLSDAQLDQAASKNVQVEQTRIAREGFVFLVSHDNPVDSLTVEQIKGIYSGQITNWSEVGGEDMPITAYQRNEDSGSQNFMKEFMGDTPLTDAPTVLRPGMMNTLVDVVAVYDGESGGIGYSVYSYVHGMYNADNGIKLLKVDGVMPDETTIADGSYPCTGYNYAVIRADEPEDSPARTLLEWILTATGQRAVASTGYYAPLDPASEVSGTLIGIELYPDGGTGADSMTHSEWYYNANVLRELLELPYENGYLNEAGNRTYTFALGLNRPVTGNAELDAEVERYMLDEIDRMVHMEPPEDINTWEDIPSIHIESEYSLVNGYLSVVISRQNRYTSAAMWDVVTGKRLTLSDLFTEGSSFTGQLNGVVFDHLDYVNDFREQPIQTIRPFYGIEAGFDNFALMGSRMYDTMNDYFLHLNLYFNQGENSYFPVSSTIACSVRELENCVLTESRDMSAYCEAQSRAYWPHEKDVQRKETIPVEGDYQIGGYAGQYRWQEITGYPGMEKINAARYAYMKENYDIEEIAWSDASVADALVWMAELLKGNYGITEPTREDLKFCYVHVYSDVCYFGSRYAAVSYYAARSYDDTIGFGTGYKSNRKLIVYDLETGEEVDYTVLFKDGTYRGTWYSGYEPCDPPAKVSDPVGISFGYSCGLDTAEGFNMEFMSPDGIVYSLELDENCLNWYP